MRRALLGVCALAVSAAAAWSSPAAARVEAPAVQAAGKFVVVFARPQNKDEAFLVELLKAAKLKEVFAGLSKALILPKNVTIHVKGGSEGPYYNPANRTIILNHEFSALAINVFTTEYPKITGYRLGQLFASLEYFVLFHELGHALVDLWELPVLGREEDAVDAFSTIFMTEFVPTGGQIALAGADFFGFLGSHHGGRYKDVEFADEHSIDLQRAYSIVCWVYGSNPTKWKSLTSILPRERGVRCPSEYRGLVKAWFKLLRPHIRKQ